MQKYKLFLYADDLNVIRRYVDADLSVHADLKSHTGGIMTFGRGVPIS